MRGGIFDNWAGEFGFTGGQLGNIGAMGLIGFCFGIIIGGLVCDKIGYGKLVVAAFACHVLSAFVTFGATNPQNAYLMLTWGMFIFAFANGTLEAGDKPAAPAPDRDAYASQLLARIGTPDAIELLGELSAGPADAPRTQAAQRALQDFSRDE